MQYKPCTIQSCSDPTFHSSDGWSNDWIDELQAINSMHFIVIFLWTLKKKWNLSSVLGFHFFMHYWKKNNTPIQSYWNVLWPECFLFRFSFFLSCCFAHLKTSEWKYILDQLSRLENNCSLYCQILHQLQEVIIEFQL